MERQGILGPLDASQDWRAVIEEVNRKIQDLTRRVYRVSQRYDTVVEDVGTTNSQIATFNENSQRLQRTVQAMRAQLATVPSSVEQTQAVVRRQMVYTIAT